MFTRQVSCAIFSLSMFLGLCHVATAKSVPIDAAMPSQQAQEEDDSIPSEQKVRRYVNPLPLEYPVHSGTAGRFDRMNVADPTVVRHDGQYYRFGTGGKPKLRELDPGRLETGGIAPDGGDGALVVSIAGVSDPRITGL